MEKKNKLIRITTVPISLKTLLKGQHRFMSDNGFEIIGISSNGQELQDVAIEENIRTISVEMTRTISPIKDLKSVWKLYNIFKKEKPKIVHTHTPKAGTVGMIAAKLAQVPIRLHTVAGLPLMEAKGFKRTLLDLVEKVTYSCATKVYPNSGGLHEFILKNKYTTPKKLKVLANGSSNGIDTTFFNPENVSEETKNNLKHQLNIQPEDTVFVFVGRLVKDKGINELVHAFKNINTEHKNAKLLLVGTYEKELDPLQTDTIKEIETNENILAVGYQTDVRPYFAIATILVFPSYREGFPNVVMQAGAMGLPSIVTNINGCNEIIDEGKNGLIIPVKDTDGLYRKMQLLLNDTSLYNHLQKNARPMISERYEQKVVWKAILEEYKRLGVLS